MLLDIFLFLTGVATFIAIAYLIFMYTPGIIRAISNHERRKLERRSTERRLRALNECDCDLCKTERENVREHLNKIKKVKS